MTKSGWMYVCGLLAASLCDVSAAVAATVYVPAGGDLQTALNNAKPGDTILLAEGAEFVGNFVLPVKSGTGWITVRTAAPDSVLPPKGRRISPSHSPLLARLRSPNSSSALKTAPGAHHWVLAYLEFANNYYGYGDILQIGDGSSAQNTLAKVPHDLVLDHLYVHGDPALGQKRGIALNAAHVTITDSYIAECKAVGQDTQAIGGWNGPGPYVIENNYLEAAGENLLLGGADPAIPNLVADGVTFRRNYVTRPMSWRDPIIATPNAVTAVAETGGALAPGTYSYRVVARRQVGQGVWVRSTASAEATASLAAGGAVRVRWEPVAGAAEYRVYGRRSGSQTVYWRVTTAEMVDTGTAGTAESVPSGKGTPWSVKNLFELKNARNVLVENNVFENHWQESQPGYSIVFTPRNTDGKCTWCTIENVRFEYNIVRNVSAGINLLAHDSPEISGIATNMVFRHNLFTGVTTTLGGNAWFLLVGEGPRDVIVEHNTVDGDGGSVVYTYGGSSTDPAVVEGFQMVANAARHSYYGMAGQYFPYGNGILTAYYPGSLFTANYLSGGPSSRYPTGNLFAGEFTDQFVDAAAGDYTVRGGSLLKGAAPDGSDIGVDFAALAARTAGVELGAVPDGAPAAPPVADFTAACTFLECTFADASVAGTSPIASRTWSFGDASGGSGATVTHTYAAAATYVVTLTVQDSGGLSASASGAVAVKAPVIPADLLVSALSAPADAPAGTNIQVVDTTANIGGGTAPPSRTLFYLSADARLDSSDTLLGSRTVTELIPAATNASNTSLLVPASVAPGSYFLVARADGDNALVESDESNNVAAAAITIQVDPLDRPDLVVSALTAPASAAAGATILVSDTTANTGKGIAAASTTRFFLSTTIFLDPSDTPLQARTVGVLDPSTVSRVTTGVTIPTGTRPGVYYLIAFADAGAALVETNELNNARWAAVRIGPDLVVSSLTAPTRAVPGGTLLVTDLTKNSGAGTTSPSTTAFYLSANTGFDPSDVRLTPSRSIPALGPGASSKASTTVTLPVVAPGTWYLIAKADDDGEVEEMYETNNARFVAVQMGPDLTFLSVMSPVSGTAGGTIAVSTSVRNTGSVEAGASLVRFYLSTNQKLDKADLQLLPARPVPALAPGTLHTTTTTLAMPSVTAGSYYLLVVADADQTVIESNEANNMVARALQIAAP